MKKALHLLMLAAATASTAAFSQAAKASNPKVAAQLIALETAGWEAWKIHDVSWAKANLADDFLLNTSSGTMTKAQYLKNTLKECQVKSYSLSDFKVIMLDANVAQMTYSVTESAVCDGNPTTPKVRSVANYARRNGKWLGVFYMQTAAK